MTKAEDWCGRWRGRGFGAGQKPKVSDEEVVAMVDRLDVPLMNTDTGQEICPRSPIPRTELVSDLMEKGMSRTPAYKRIDSLIAKGLLMQGKNPFPRTDGVWPDRLYVWANREKTEDVPIPGAMSLLDFMRSRALGAENAMSMRAVEKAWGGGSLATVSRRINEEIATGTIARNDQGYYAIETLDVA